MAQRFHVHPDNPQERLLKQAVALLRDGAVIIYPTDTTYALACQLDNKLGMERMRRIRQLSHKHHFSLLCTDLAMIGQYAFVDKHNFRLLKHLAPGPYTFILKASSQVPRRLLPEKLKTIGIRIPSNPVAQMLLALNEEPIVTTSLIGAQETAPVHDPDEIYEKYSKQVDLMLDSGHCGTELTTIVDLTTMPATIQRVGKGNPPPVL